MRIICAASLMHTAYMFSERRKTLYCVMISITTKWARKKLDQF